MRLNAKLPKKFYIPSIYRYISTADYVRMWKRCKANPGARVERTICKFWGGTTEDVIREIREGLHDRINLRGMIK